MIVCLFKEFQLAASYEGLVETVPGVNQNLLKLDTYIMDPAKDPLFRGEFEVVKELQGLLKNGAAAKNVCDKVVDKNGTKKTGGTGIKQLEPRLSQENANIFATDSNELPRNPCQIPAWVPVPAPHSSH